MIVKLLTEHYYEFLSLNGGCRGSSKSTHVKMPHCWESRALAHIYPDCKIPMSHTCAYRSFFCTATQLRNQLPKMQFLSEH